MSVAALFWRRNDRLQGLNRQQVTLPLIMYLANFAFAMFMSLGAGIYVPILLGLMVGALPAVMCWWATPEQSPAVSRADTQDAREPQLAVVEVATTPAGVSK